MKMVMGHGLLLNNILGKKIITMPKTDTILSVKSLRYFLQLIDTMNYTQAAQILGITQPALTQQVKNWNMQLVLLCLAKWVRNCT